MANAKVTDDYSLERVPQSAKSSVWQVTIVRLGSLCCVSQLMVGASLGYGMTFGQAMLSVLLGSVILQVIGAAVGIIAAREGLTISLLTRWAGFGNIGSAIIGLVIAISLIGWFGVQNSVFAEGIYDATKIFNVHIWALITGLIIIFIVVYGFKMLSYTANITLPLFLLAVVIASVKMFNGTDLFVLLSSAAPGPQLSLPTAVTEVTGGFVVGAVITPDMSRFLKKGKDVFWMVLISTFVGELGMCALAVLMSHVVKSNDVITIMLSLSGLLGVIIVIVSTLKVNDINLYSSSLGFTTSIDSLFGKKMNRATVTIGIGLIGTILSVIGIIDYFVSFLTLLGVAIPPIVGIIVIDYWFLKRDRRVLDESRKTNRLPNDCEKWNPVAISAWLCGFLVGIFITDLGIPSINALISSAMVYIVLMLAVAAVQKKKNAAFSRTAFTPKDNLDESIWEE